MLSDRQKKDTHRIAARAEELALQYLEDTNNYPWYNGEVAFVDEETYGEHAKYRLWRNAKHLYEEFVVKITSDEEGADWVVTNRKDVDGWNLLQMLEKGTRGYSHPKGMSFWSKYKKRWYFNMPFRRGIQEPFMSMMDNLERDAIAYGLVNALQEYKQGEL